MTYRCPHSCVAAVVLFRNVIFFHTFLLSTSIRARVLDKLAALDVANAKVVALKDGTRKLQAEYDNAERLVDQFTSDVAKFTAQFNRLQSRLLALETPT